MGWCPYCRRDVGNLVRHCAIYHPNSSVIHTLNRSRAVRSRRDAWKKRGGKC